MAEFEGKLNLNVETSEIEIKGKFKLTEDELDTVIGGTPSWLKYPVVGLDDSCDEWVENGLSLGGEKSKTCGYCLHLHEMNNIHFCTK